MSERSKRGVFVGFKHSLWIRFELSGTGDGWKMEPVQFPAAQGFLCHVVDPSPKR